MEKMFEVIEVLCSFGGMALEENVVFAGSRDQCEQFVKSASHTGACTVFVYEVRPS